MTGGAADRARRRWGTPPPPSGVPASGQAEPTTVSRSAVDRQQLQAAARRQQLERERSTTPVPARIKYALDARKLDGPEVDVACGAVEPAVDRWETGEEVPTGEQVQLLAALTGFPVEFFYAPVEAGTVRTLMCGRGGLTVATETVDERGVSTTVFEEHPKRRRKPAAAEQQPAGPVDPLKPHRFVKDPVTPTVCSVCELPKANRRRHP